MAERTPLDELAATLVDLAAVPTAPLRDDVRVANDEWVDRDESAYWRAWCRVCDVVRERLGPLNHVRSPVPGLADADDRYLDLVTVHPQDEPGVKLHVTYRADGTLDALAEFDDPVSDGWEPLYHGGLADYDDAQAERIRNEIVYIREGMVRAEELREETVLSAREARVRALSERGYDPERIAEILDLNRESVETALARIEERIDDARRTVEILG